MRQWPSTPEDAVQLHIGPDAEVDNDEALRSTRAIEAELGMWSAFLRDTVRNSMGLVAAEVWQDVDEGEGVQLRRVAYYTDPVYTRAMLQLVPCSAPCRRWPCPE